MKNGKVILGMRIILGLILVIFGANKFLNFMPMPPLPAQAADFFGALMKSGYIMPLVGIVELIAGVLLLTNKYVPIALLILAPISVNIIAFHVVLAPAQIGAAALVGILNVLLLFAYKDRFNGVLAS